MRGESWEDEGGERESGGTRMRRGASLCPGNAIPASLTNLPRHAD